VGRRGLSRSRVCGPRAATPRSYQPCHCPASCRWATNSDLMPRPPPHCPRPGSLPTRRRRDYIVLTMRSRLIRIGNSRGVRLPKPLIDEAGLTDEIEIRVRNGAIVIENAAAGRADWEDAAKSAHTREDDALLDAPVATRFDEEEWDW
jgi:antitoxin MazE